MSTTEIEAGLRRRFNTSAAWSIAREFAFGTDDHSVARRTAATAFAIRVASAAIVYLSQVLLARWMGTHEFGIYVYVWTWVLLIGALVDVGLSLSAPRFIPEYTASGKLEALRGFIVGSRRLAVAIATAAALIAAGAVKLFEPWIDNGAALPLLLACIALPFYALGNMSDGFARSYNWINLALAPPYLIRPLLLLALMAAAYWAGLPRDAATAVLLFVAATWVTAIGQVLMLDRRIAATLPAGPRAYPLKTWFAVSIPLLMVEGFYVLLTYTDVLILNAFRPPEEVAIYFAASKTLALVAFVYFSVAAAVAHRFTAMHVAGEREKLDRFLGDAIRWTFWPSLAATIVILALGKPFLWLFGPKFLTGYPLMFILSIGLMARATIGPIERLLNMLGEQRVCAMVYAASFVVNLIACLLLIPRYGIFGAAWSMSLALCVETVLLFWAAKQRLGFNVLAWTIPKRWRKTPPAEA